MQFCIAQEVNSYTTVSKTLMFQHQKIVMNNYVRSPNSNIIEHENSFSN